ncbi:unnamed protein product [Mytilus coruscus]|uniref:Uncharacterized protein n=1 Tax=Mytilus coruscus TaxID=42192 RepID=A0A6J8DM60_MYTCO|nr:unnamed protein product [Mytilus coruscus]
MSACSILTSGDIDAISIHLYSLSKKLPKGNGRYSHTVSWKTNDQIDTRLLRNAKLWLPPESCLERMAELVNLQIEYLETTGDSMAKLPKFLEKDCLKMTETGEVEFYFGPLARENIEHLLGNHKRQMNETPQKGKRKKKCLHQRHLSLILHLYRSLFSEAEIDGALFLKLKVDDLQDLFKSFVKRKKVRDIIRDGQEKEKPEEDMPVPFPPSSFSSLIASLPSSSPIPPMFSPIP